MDLSLVASTFQHLRIEPPSKLTLLEAHQFSSRHFPPTPPDVDTLILNVDSSELAAQVKTVLLAIYPPEHSVKVVHGDRKTEINLDRLDEGSLARPFNVFIPALEEGTSFESFAEIVAHLRAPDGCPWDREQTHQSLRKHLLEESYETITAMDAEDVTAMGEEFGDLLLQVVLNSQIASENDHFTIKNVIKNIFDKIIRRHPHVFGDLKLDGVDGVLANWEKLKEQERGEKKEKKGILDGVPSALPALSQAQEYQDRVARVGFDWPEIDGMLDKIREEIDEVRNAETDFELASEMGDLIFALVNLARWKRVDAESALRGTNIKFKRRFQFVENETRKLGRSLSEMSLEEMEALWQKAKKVEA